MIDNIRKTDRNIDMVFCIDGTGSMGPCIDNVKNNAKRFYLDFTKALTDLNSEIISMRIKFVVFRDYKDDGNEAMIESPFFELPTDNDDFERYLANITAYGGGDNPENGLEALYYAMKSDFTTKSKDRQIIVLFTDADALELKERQSEPNYPKDMVDKKELIDMWSCVGQNPDYKLRDKLKRLILFAPTGTKYQELSKQLNRSIFEPVDMSTGLEDIDFSDIIKIIAASV